MGRAPCCDKDKVKRGPWAPEEDETLKNYLHNNGTGGNWIALPNKAGLKRCGKSCRLRWLNYLRPNIKHGYFTPEEDALILDLYSHMGSRWSVIASKLPGRTDNDVKNHWNTKLKKKLMAAQQQQQQHNHHHHHHQPTITTPSSAYLFPKIEVYKPENSTFSYNSQQIIMQPLVDVNYGGQIIMNNNTTITQEGSSISDSSSLAAVDSNYGSLTNFGKGFSNDFMGNYVWNYQDYEAFFEEVVDPVLNDPTNSFVNSAMCQNVTNIFY